MSNKFIKIYDHVFSLSAIKYIHVGKINNETGYIKIVFNDNKTYRIVGSGNDSINYLKSCLDKIANEL